MKLKDTEPRNAPDLQLLVQPSGLHCTLERGQSLLLAALAGGVVLPSSCRNGTCRACLSRVLQGTVSHRIPWPGLSHEEKAQGFCLPCVAEAQSDLALWQPDAYRLG